MHIIFPLKPLPWTYIDSKFLHVTTHTTMQISQTWVWQVLFHERNQVQTTQGDSRKCPDTIWPTWINGLLSNLKVKVDTKFRVVPAALAVLLWIQGTNIIMRTSHKPNFSRIGWNLAEIWRLKLPRMQVLIISQYLLPSINFVSLHSRGYILRNCHLSLGRCLVLQRLTVLLY